MCCASAKVLFLAALLVMWTPGASAFTFIEIWSAPIPTPGQMIAGDLDSDGYVDAVLAARKADEVWWLKNTGATQTGGFESSTFTFDEPAGIAVADFNGDSKLDVLVCGWGYDSGHGLLGIYWNDGSGIQQSSRTTYASNVRMCMSADAADMNGDGHIDFLLPIHSWGSKDGILLFVNDGSNEPDFTEYQITTSPGVDVKAAHLDPDGAVDFAAPYHDYDTLWWYKNGGESTPSFTATTVTSNANFALHLKIGDIDGDGTNDLVLVSPWDSTLRVFLNDGSENPQFDSEVVVSIKTEASSVRGIEICDLDGDGNLEMIWATSEGTFVFQATSTNPLAFSEILIDSRSSAYPLCLDANLDGSNDVLLQVEGDDSWELSLMIQAAPTPLPTSPPSKIPVLVECMDDQDCPSDKTCKCADADQQRKNLRHLLFGQLGPCHCIKTEA